MSKETSLKRTIAAVDMISDEKWVQAVTALTDSISEQLGYTREDRLKLQLAVEECFVNSVRHAYSGQPDRRVRVVFERRPANLVIAVEDDGLPFGSLEVPAEKGGALGVVLMKASVDEVCFFNLGKQGKRVELRKSLPFESVARVGDFGGEKHETEAFPEDMPIEIRMMRADEGDGVARCVYRTYGFKYISDHLYFPGKIRQLLESGLYQPCVAVTPDDEIVGHVALTLDKSDSLVGEVGQGVVDPRCRGRGLYTRMKQYMIDHAGREGRLGVYSESVTVHTHTQKANITLGAHEIGCLLAYIPESLDFRDFQAGGLSCRQTVMMYYNRISDSKRVVHVPGMYEHLVQKIYQGCGLQRDVVADKDILGSSLPDEPSVVDISVKPEWGHGFVRVLRHGRDVIDVVGRCITALAERDVACIYVDLRMSDPLTAWFCSSVLDSGLVFGGIIPEMDKGDVLRLQCLNNIPIDESEIRVCSDFGREMLDYVIGCLNG